MEIPDEYKSHHAALDRVRIQRMIIQAAELSRAHHAILELVCIQIMRIQAAESS